MSYEYESNDEQIDAFRELAELLMEDSRDRKSRLPAPAYRRLAPFYVQTGLDIGSREIAIGGRRTP